MRLNVLPCMLAVVYPQRTTVLVENERNRDEGDRQEAEQTAGPANTKLVVHGAGKERKSSTEGGSEEIVASVDRGNVGWVGVTEVVKAVTVLVVSYRVTNDEDLHSVEEAECTDREEPGADDRHDPVRVTCTPSKPKEANRNAESAEEGWWESLLGLDVTLVVEFGLLVVVQVGKVEWNGKNSANHNTQESSSLQTEREAVHLHKDNWEGLEPDVQKTVNEGDVEVEKEDHWLLEVEGDWTNENHHNNVLAGHGLSYQLWLANQILVSSQLP